MLNEMPAGVRWTPAERESFFEAVARHRRAAWRVTATSRMSAFGVALIVAMLMSPLLYGILGLLLDAINWITPTPDLVKRITDTVGDIIDHPQAVSLGRALYIGGVAAFPGAAVMALALRTLERVMGEAMSLEAGDLEARAPRVQELSEQRFVNVIAEMALAAGVPAPRVLVTESSSANAAAFGSGDRDATVVVTTGLLATLDRAELQAVVAHLIGSIADGDMKIGTRTATVLGLFGLIAQLSRSFGDREAARRFAKLLLASLRRGASKADSALAMMLANPFDEPSRPSAELSDTSNKVPWRTIAWTPLIGPLVLSGFFGGMVATILLGPLLSLTWRRRKYMADATAVRLTRDPDALATALRKLSGSAVQGAFSSWISHMSVVPDVRIGARTLFGGSAVRMAPSYERRLRALTKMGAQPLPAASKSARRQVPAIAWFAIVPVAALLIALLSVALFLLVYVSVAMSGLFTWLPVVLLHAILR